MQRLEAVLKLIDKCKILADIGCDHGKLSLNVIKNGLADTVYATDISPSSLDKAKKLLYNCPACHCILSDGFMSLPKTPCTAVITGMGGHEIIKIISQKTVKTLILGPQNQAGLLRERLLEFGYEIVNDMVIAENNKFYDIIKAVYTGKVTSLDLTQACYGMFYKVKSQNLLDKVLLDEKKLLGFKKTPQNTEKLKAITEVKKWQQ